MPNKARLLFIGCSNTKKTAKNKLEGFGDSLLPAFLSGTNDLRVELPLLLDRHRHQSRRNEDGPFLEQRQVELRA